jgi:hypothetical protein
VTQYFLRLVPKRVQLIDHAILITNVSSKRVKRLVKPIPLRPSHTGINNCLAIRTQVEKYSISVMIQQMKMKMKWLAIDVPFSNPSYLLHLLSLLFHPPPIHHSLLLGLHPVGATQSHAHLSALMPSLSHLFTLIMLPLMLRRGQVALKQLLLFP